MWCPEGFLTWTDVVSKLIETAEEVVSLVSIECKPIAELNGKYQLVHSAEFYLKSRGFAEDYREAEVIVAIVAVFLLVNFLEEYPPILSNIDGNRITGEWPLFCHRDQIEACYLHWPIKDDAQFHSFFRYVTEGNFGPEDLFDRFAFIEGATGRIGLKNGSEHYLINGLGYADATARYCCEVAKQLRDYFVFWPSFPDDEKYREFLGCIEISETFTKALDLAYGASVDEPMLGAGLEHAYRCFRNAYPDGKGKVPWHIVEKKTGYSRRQINRALRAHSEENGPTAGQDSGQNPI